MIRFGFTKLTIGYGLSLYENPNFMAVVLVTLEGAAMGIGVSATRVNKADALGAVDKSGAILESSGSESYKKAVDTSLFLLDTFGPKKTWLCSGTMET